MKLPALSSRLMALAALGAAPTASAQQILFADDFDGTLDQWTMTGQWHQATQDDSCTWPASPFPSPMHAARFGDDQCFFDGVGDLTMVEPLLIPEWATNARLSFRS